MSRIRVERRLEIRGNMSRSEIRRKVVEAFLDEEPGEKYEYWYHVETLSAASGCIFEDLHGDSTLTSK